MRFRNASGLKFEDLSSEEYREYLFLTAYGREVVRITDPLKIHTSKSGGHRIFTADGLSHYIPAGWLMLTWKVRPGRPHFDF